MFACRSVALAGALGLLLASRGASAQTGRELNVIPIAGGDSDVGVGAGAVGDLASLEPGSPPYRWRLEATALTTFKIRGGNLVLPYQDEFLQLTLPRLGRQGSLRLDARAAFTDEVTLKYYGIGNASPPRPPGVAVELLEYARLHPTLSVETRVRIASHFGLLIGSAYTYNRLTVSADTLLAQQQAAGLPAVRALLGDFGAHGVEVLTFEAQWDSRDDETVTRHGQLHTLRFRASPRVSGALPYEYERLTLATRFYATVVERWLGVSCRFVGDTLLGTPPFYELARFDETPAIGGGKAVRGVPAQRYYGKVKVFGNLEAVSEVWPFSIKDKPFVLGLAAFVDAGRTWTELTRRHPDLDGTGLGLKYGIGGGLRLQEGHTFIVRLDVAWSPDASPVGAYFAAGQIF
jgi:hypothetical protein